MTSRLNLITPHEEWCHSKNCWLQIFQSKKIIISTLVLSIIIHAAFFIHFSGLQNKHDVNKKISHSIEIILTKITPEQSQIEKIITPTEPPVKKIITESELVKETNKPAKKILEEQPIEELEKKQPDMPIEEPANLVSSQPLNTPTDPALINSEKEKYLKHIAAHLDKHKFYPRSAKRRHIEGDVKVSFDLLLDGYILNLHTLSGHIMLQEATSRSVHDALPLPKRPDSLLSLNTMKIEYTMLFSLKD
ncbi:MAG: TonB family protein [Gammaproteobacteria bacterium]|nr:TonB family protein [Gammaproteobacteria bacterium]MCW8910774.1 TonB family protein [Gammaproteobacteria bacterium]MCW9004900.1 TonB family protein [Gammaproteobacteria bacterium]